MPARKRTVILYVNVISSLLMLAAYFFLGGMSPSGGSGTLPEGALRPPTAESTGPLRLSGYAAGKTIVIDPGHGGDNPGALGRGPLPEKDIVLAIAHNLKAMLEHAGAKVVMTRTGDETLGKDTVSQLAARTRLANRSGADVFVSIHANWHRDGGVRGVETYYCSRTGKRLAGSIQQGVTGEVGAPSLGTKFGDLYVLRNSRMPAVLVEVGFLSNRSEAVLLAQPEYQERVARGIYFGLEHYFSGR